MKKATLICLLLNIFFILQSQETIKPDANTPSDTTKHKKEKSEKSENKNHKLKSLHKMIWAADTLTESDYMMSVERVNDKLNDIRDSVKLGFEVEIMQERTAQITKDIKEIREYMGGRRSHINLKNIYLYQNFLADLSDENKEIKQKTNIIYNRFYWAKNKLKVAMKDSVFRALYTDSVARKEFSEKLSRLQRKWMRTDSMDQSGIKIINDLKVDVSDNTMSLSNMLNMIDNRLEKARKQLYGKETNALWEPTPPDTIQKGGQPVASALTTEKNAMSYYHSKTSGGHITLLLLMLLLIGWWFYKRWSLQKNGMSLNSLQYLQLNYLKNYPVWSLMLVVMCMLPFVDAYAPTSYMICEYLCGLAVASVIFYKQWNRKLWYQWLGLVALFIALSLTYIFGEPTLLVRLWMLALHTTLIISIYKFYKNAKQDTSYPKWKRFTFVISILVAFLAITNNLFGRFSLSGIMGISAVVAITQAYVLPIFADTILEIILVQIQSSRVRKGILLPFNKDIVINKIRMPLMIVMTILWLIMLTSDMNIYHMINDGLDELFNSTRSIGSFSFKLSSVLLFVIIIWIAHILQRLISFLFGETGDDTEDIDVVSKGLHSRLLISRLIVLCGGYLLAVGASGLPIDKITIVLGALGVGIGMGLQNVVNNFVSGIILIFDGSLKIGDVIEISGQSGKVKEIGLRASTINTADGAEVIIPNGSILSQNIVNWTFSNDQRRTMIEFSLTGAEIDTNLVTEVINQTMLEIPEVISNKKPVIVFTKVQDNTCWLIVRYWTNISVAEASRSQALLHLSKNFKKHQIVMDDCIKIVQK